MGVTGLEQAEQDAMAICTALLHMDEELTAGLLRGMDLRAVRIIGVLASVLISCLGADAALIGSTTEAELQSIATGLARSRIARREGR